ncbi:hypothetical protein H8L32_23000 [Undibacterium sp. CY18W]|uniref:Uncharacterized protein n=1 Tax=Undibacterium hunanense TaxID=2762292 RepID=A0ABR6ZWX4_9BURK|nr:hypothetical protein [Undibacterium hunanense]MBC3920350.1 hypothetical protein [Undibacterium hunanense]
MIEYSLGTLPFRDGVVFLFPNHLCCNCGKTTDLTTIAQDTRRTTYMVGAGTEITFKLPLPFCKDCAPTATRRPKSLLNWSLIFIGTFAASALALIIIGDMVLNSALIARYLVPFALALAALACAGMVALTRPKGKQTSYFQPVRIPRLKQEFVSGAVTAIGFSFSNLAYAKAFALVNRESIAKKLVTLEAV